MYSDKDLIQKASEIAIPRQLSLNSDAGRVGCCLITDKGNIYTGCSIDTPCGMGFCAEANAIGNMLTNGEQNIAKIVAVHCKEGIYSPCGRCREFIFQVSEYNSNTKVILKGGKTTTIKELLPEHRII